MTKKDYVAIAKMLDGIESAGAVDSDFRSGFNYGLDIVARELCDLFERGNPRFDRARFLAACGVTA